MGETTLIITSRECSLISAIISLLPMALLAWRRIHLDQKGTWTKGFGSKWVHLNFQKTCVVLDGRWNAVIFSSLNMLSSAGRHSEKASQDIPLRGPPSVLPDYVVAATWFILIQNVRGGAQSRALLRSIPAAEKVADMKLCSTGKTKVGKKNKPTKGWQGKSIWHHWGK